MSSLSASSKTSDKQLPVVISNTVEGNTARNSAVQINGPVARTVSNFNNWYVYFEASICKVF
jgi:hypothetical protein